jgi:hypothetical protein
MSVCIHLCLSMSMYSFVSVHLSVYPPNFCYEAYEITLLSVCLFPSTQYFRFLCGPCRIKEKLAINSSHNFLFYFAIPGMSDHNSVRE